MKIAVVTDDGKTVSSHFGMARSYLVFEIEGGEVKGKETRPKASHHHAPGAMHHDGAENSLHQDMLSNVRDCEAIVARGMGRPMYEAIVRAGIRPYLTGRVYVDDVVGGYVDGTLDDLAERLH